MEKRTIFLIIALVISASLIIAGLMQEKQGQRQSEKLDTRGVIETNKIIAKSIDYNSPEYNNLTVDEKNRFEDAIKNIDKSKVQVSLHREERP